MGLLFLGGGGVSGEFPLRPMTVAEILDAGVSVLRRRPLVLAMAAAMAAAEQFGLKQLRDGLGMHRLTAPQLIHHFGPTWMLMSAGMGSEAAILALLGGVCGPVAARLLLHEVAGAPQARLRPRRLALIATSAAVAAGASITFFAGGLPWVFWFMLTGLAVPALTIDGGVPDPQSGKHGGPATFARAIAFSTRGGLRAGRVRLLSYLPWLLVRLALSLVGGAGVASLAGVRSSTAVTAIDYTLWISMNALMYATIASMDAATHLEARMRVEGLDIALHQAARRGGGVEPVLAAPR